MLETKRSDPRPGAAEPRRADAASWRVFLLLIAMSAIGPTSLNILQPALPHLAETLRSDPGIVQLTLSLYLLGLGASQLVMGPLSDRFGRRPVVLAGLALTTVSSVAAMAATSIEGLVAARLVQSLGASTGLAVGRAIIRDLYERDRAASMIGWVTMAMVLAPMVAPLIGGALDDMLGWQAIFGFLALATAIVLAGAAVALPETRAQAPPGGRVSRLGEETAALARSPSFAGYVLAAAISSAMYFAFIGGAPHVFITQMGGTPTEYGLWFAVGSFGYMAGNYIAARWSARVGVDTMIHWGLWIGLVAALAEAVVVLLAPHWGPATIFVPQAVISFGAGFLLPNAVAGAVSVRPQAAGTAAGITGFAQMALGAAVTQHAGTLLAGSPTAVPLALFMAVLVTALVLSFAVLVRRP